jgi:hypothetical protein
MDSPMYTSGGTGALNGNGPARRQSAPSGTWGENQRARLRMQASKSLEDDASESALTERPVGFVYSISLQISQIG